MRGQYSRQERERGAESEIDDEKDIGKEIKVSHIVIMLFSHMLVKIFKS